MLIEIEQYKFKLRLQLTALGAFSALVFSFIEFFSEDYLASVLSLMGTLHFASVVFYLVKEKHYLWEGRGYAIVLSVIFLNTIDSHPEYGIFWAYVMVTYIFLLMKLKEATLVACLFMATTFYLINDHYSTIVLMRIHSTLLLVSAFAFVFSLLVERLLTRVNSLITHDPLTNALNRHTFHTSIDSALNTFHRYKTPSSLFIFDLDFFKKINDTFGHQAGDRVLKDVSYLILKRLRDCDHLFRYGGEEFAVLLTQTAQDDAMKLAEELRQLIEDHDHQLGYPVTISGGVSQVQECDQVNTWIERCDKALYKAKANGRNKVLYS